MAAATADLPAALKLLAEPTRLRILALLEREELSVGELAESLGMAQSRVSNHLRQLREAGFLVERHAGTSTFLRAVAATNGAVTHRLWGALRAEVEGLAEHGADLARLEGVLARRDRREDFFDRVAGQWDKISGEFETGQARQRALAHLLPAGLTVADLGCGTGYLASALAGIAGRIVCVDRSAGMLEEARKRLARSARGTRIEYRAGELDALPIADDEVDAALAGMVLHHLAGLDGALAEVRRVVRPGGSAVVIDLAPHREAWMHQALGDRHLGLDASDVMAAFQRAGFEDVALDPLEDRYRPRGPEGQEPALAMVLVRGRAPID